MDPSEDQPAGRHTEEIARFAETGLALGVHFSSATLLEYIHSLAALTGSDLVLVYESRQDSLDLDLSVQFGLPEAVWPTFWRLGDEQSEGAGGRRAGSRAPPVSYDPLTSDLEALGIRAYLAYPLWSDGRLLGQMFVGSRRWDQFHSDTLRLFAASAGQVRHALRKRRLEAVSPDTAPTWTEAADGDATKGKQQFIAVLAHELRNPIAPIRSGLDLLATGLLDAEGRDATLEMMQRQLSHLVRLTDDLLDTVRLDTGRLQVRREPVLLRDVVRSAIESVHPALRAKSQALRLDDAEAEVVVDVDPVRLSQAFVNILSANVKETPECGVIAVSVALRPPELIVTFEDEGKGFDPTDIDHVFELFPKSAAQKSDDGLGIGLALVKGLVELHDGSVDVRNREAANGSIYTVRLPVSNAETPSRDTTEETSVNPWPSHRILIVDDNQDAANTLGLLFELDGSTVRLAHDGPSAVAEANEFQPEVILMDIGLPVFNGIEATARIRREEGPVRPFIVALTGWGAKKDRAATLASGCDMHLVKPIPYEALRRTIQERMSTGTGAAKA